MVPSPLARSWLTFPRPCTELVRLAQNYIYGVDSRTRWTKCFGNLSAALNRLDDVDSLLAEDIGRFLIAVVMIGSIYQILFIWSCNKRWTKIVWRKDNIMQVNSSYFNTYALVRNVCVCARVLISREISSVSLYVHVCALKINSCRKNGVWNIKTHTASLAINFRHN